MPNKLVSVLGDSVIGAECNSSPTTVGVALTVFAGGFPIHINQGLNSTHTIGPQCESSHAQPLMATSVSVRVEGNNIGRDGDSYTGCDGTVKAILQPTVFAGD